MRKIITTLLLIYLLIAPSVSAQTPIPTLPVGSNTFLETFDGAPATPQPWNSPKFDIAKQKRFLDTNWEMDTVQAHHGPDCAPPLLNGQLVTHRVDNFRDSVFLCKDHVMTAVHGGDYGLIYLTPASMIDFTNEEAVIRFDMTTFRSSTRDWVDIWITPWEDNLTLPFNMGDVDVQGVPKRSIQITQQDANGNGTMWHPHVYRNFNDTEFPDFSNTYNWWTGYETFLAPDPEFGNRRESPKRRDTFELRLKPNPNGTIRLKFGMPAYNFWWADKDIQNLGWTKGIIQFGHHSYTPEKDCGTPGTLRCSANTWHWDNIYMNPTIPFTVIKSDKNVITPNTTVTFDSPAPANSFLRFAAIGAVEISVNNSTTWQAVAKQPASFIQQNKYNAGHYTSHFAPIPAGTRTVKFRFNREVYYTDSSGVHYYEGPFFAKDFAIWSQSVGPAVPTPTIGSVTPTGTRKPGDCDRDGDVDIFDYNILVGTFGLTTDLRGDFNNNNNIDIFDYNTLVGNFGN